MDGMKEKIRFRLSTAEYEVDKQEDFKKQEERKNYENYDYDGYKFFDNKFDNNWIDEDIDKDKNNSSPQEKT